LELRKQLQEKPTSDGKPMTRKEADSCNKALASGALDSDGIFTFRVKGTREQIVERILEVRELWNEPMTRAEAEAKADTAIRVTWGQRVFAWLSWAGESGEGIIIPRRGLRGSRRPMRRAARSDR
jgi:hypothetical protein